jgi:hypothetical protein
MVGSHFLLPPSQKMLNEDERSSAPNDDDPLAFLVFLSQVSQGSPPPWPGGTRALGQREILASWLTRSPPPDSIGSPFGLYEYAFQPRENRHVDFVQS